MHILFVCTGNICRSPTAEGLTRAYSEAYLADPSELTTASAGIHALVGSPMEPTALQVLEGLGGQGRDFRARQLEPVHVAAADVVLTMTQAHRAVVLSSSPRALPRTFTLREARALAAGVPQHTLPSAGDLLARGRALVAAMARGRATRAGEGGSDDILDPIGAGAQTFLEVGESIAEALIPWLAACTGRTGTADGMGTPDGVAIQDEELT